MPTTRNAGSGPWGGGDWPAGLFPPCAWLSNDTRINVPMCTPLSLASVYDASTSLADDWSGSRPETSFTIRGRLRGGTSQITKLLASIGLRQDEQRGAAVTGATTGVTDATEGRRASCGSGCPLYTTTS